jgi:hypothetical protein
MTAAFWLTHFGSSVLFLRLKSLRYWYYDSGLFYDSGTSTGTMTLAQLHVVQPEVIRMPLFMICVQPDLCNVADGRKFLLVLTNYWGYCREVKS